MRIELKRASTLGSKALKLAMTAHPDKFVGMAPSNPGKCDHHLHNKCPEGEVALAGVIQYNKTTYVVVKCSDGSLAIMRWSREPQGIDEALRLQYLEAFKNKDTGSERMHFWYGTSMHSWATCQGTSEVENL
jgi:hypothetical protein